VRLADVTFCVLDLETTGCDAGVDGITEIGAVKVRGGERVGEFHTLVNARQSIPTFIAMLTGISDAMLADAPPIGQVLPSLIEFLRGSVVVGHNIRFDLRFLNAALDGAGYDRLTDAAVDTVPLARRLVRDDVPDCRLATLATALRIEHLPTHRALDDALATTELLHLLIERATGFGVLALDDLFELPRVAGHRYSAKLPMTNHLPRQPGVYLFHGGRDDVIHVGRADDIRRSVRRYFASRDRRRIAPMLREVRRISAIPIEDPVAAEVTELRLVQRHRPRYDKAALGACSATCYVHIDERGRRPPTLVRQPRTSGTHLGPLPTTQMGRMVVHALTADDAPATAHRALAGALARQDLMDAGRRCGRTSVVRPSGTLELDHGMLSGLMVQPSGAVDWTDSDRPLPRWAGAEVLRVARRLRLAET
jgi:DNA polymerase-3 subunit epsilon